MMFELTIRKKEKLDRVGPVDNRPSTNKKGGPKQLCGGTSKNTLLINWEKRQKSFILFILNIVTYVFHNVIQVAPLGRETVNMVM